MADDVGVEDEQHGEQQEEEHAEQREEKKEDKKQDEKKQERARESAGEGLAIAAALILAARYGRGGRPGLPPVGRPGDTRIPTARGDGWWCW
jgi:hypothetical protein